MNKKDELTIDSNKWSITKEELREFKDFKEINDEEADNVLATLLMLAIIAMESKKY